MAQSRNSRNNQNSKRGNSDTKNFGIRYMAVDSIRAVAGEGNERKRIISFSSEEPYKRYFGMEILDHNGKSVDLMRLNTIGVLLFNHDRDEVVGKVIRAWVENNRGLAEVEFDSDEKAETIFQKVKSGTLKGVSVNYTVKTWEEVVAGERSTDGRFQGPCSIATAWMPLEVSIVSVPADPTVGVDRDMGDEFQFTPGVLTPETAQRQITINQNYFLGGQNHE